MKERIKQLNTLISALCVELDSLPMTKSQLLIDDDDEYQDNLELGWHKDELQGRLDAYEEERLLLWQQERDEAELNALESQSNES